MVVRFFNVDLKKIDKPYSVIIYDFVIVKLVVSSF